MSFLHSRFGTLALASVALFSQACISKGDTVINGKDKDKPPVMLQPDAGSELIDATTSGGDVTTSDTSDDSDDTTAPSTTSDDDTPTETDTQATSEETDPTDTNPTETETDTDEETDSTDTDATETDEEPDEPPGDPVACAMGLKPTKSEPVQLTTSGTSKAGLKVLQTDEGYALSWLETDLAIKHVVYQMFDSDLVSRFDEQTVPEIEDAQSVAVAWTGSEGITAFDHSGTVRVTRWDPSTGEVIRTKDTLLPSHGRKLYANYLSDRLFLGTMVGIRCGTTDTFRAMAFDLGTELGVEVFPDGGCVYDVLSVFDVSATSVGYVTPGGSMPGRFDFVDVSSATPSSGAGVDARLNVNPGLLMGRAQGLFSVAALNGQSVRYGRLKDDGTLLDDAVDVTLTGTLQGLAFTDEAAGVLVENQATLSLFARGIGDEEGKSYHPVGVVAAEKGLKESTLVANGDQFVVFFLADDPKGKVQVFASEILCESK